MKLPNVLISMLLLCYSQAESTVLEVPSSYPTIQSALSAANNYDTILVAPGIYLANITWPAKTGLKLLSSGGPSVTTLSGGVTGRVMTFNSGVLDTSTVISGFTVTDGYLAAGWGAGIFISGCSVSLENMIITNNRLSTPGMHSYGAGVYMINSSSVLKNCDISGNSIDTATWAHGAGLYIQGGSPELHSLTISGNTSRSKTWVLGVGIYVWLNANLKIYNTVITENNSGDNANFYVGNGIHIYQSTVEMNNVLIALNQSGAGGSFSYGGGMSLENNSHVTLNHVTIANNTKSANGNIDGSGIYSENSTVLALNSILYNPNSGAEILEINSTGLSINFSNIRNGYPGNGNLSVLPNFVSATNFHLSPGSPCAGAGTLAVSIPFDLDGTPRPLPALTNPDLGCYEVDQTATSVNDSPVAASIMAVVFPNPAGQNQTVSIKHVVDGFIQIMDITGRTLVTGFIQNSHFDFIPMGWDPGIYIVKTEDGKSVRFILQ